MNLHDVEDFRPQAVVAWGYEHGLLVCSTLLIQHAQDLVHYGMALGLISQPHKPTAVELHDRHKAKQRECMRRLRSVRHDDQDNREPAGGEAT